MKQLGLAEVALNNGELIKSIQLILSVVELIKEGKYPYYDIDKGVFVESNHAELFCTRISSVITAIVANEDFDLTQDIYEQLCLNQKVTEDIFNASSYENSSFLFKVIGDVQGKNTNISSLKKLRKFLSVTPLNCTYLPFIDLLPNIPSDVSCPYILGILANGNPLNLHGIEMKRQFYKVINGIPEYEWNNRHLEYLAKSWRYCIDPLFSESMKFRRSINLIISNLMGVEAKAEVNSKVCDEETILFLISSEYLDSDIVEITKSRIRDRYKLIAVTDDLDYDNKDELFDLVVKFDVSFDKFDIFIRKIKSLSPNIIYYADLYSNLWAPLLINLRIAGLQIVGWNQPDSTMSENIDYLIRKPGFNMEDKGFTEKLLVLDDGDDLLTEISNLG